MADSLRRYARTQVAKASQDEFVMSTNTHTHTFSCLSGSLRRTRLRRLLICVPTNSAQVMRGSSLITPSSVGLACLSGFPFFCAFTVQSLSVSEQKLENENWKISINRQSEKKKSLEQFFGFFLSQLCWWYNAVHAWVTDPGLASKQHSPCCRRTCHRCCPLATKATASCETKLKSAPRSLFDWGCLQFTPRLFHSAALFFSRFG